MSEDITVHDLLKAERSAADLAYYFGASDLHEKYDLAQKTTDTAVGVLRERLAAAETVLTEARDIARSSSVPLGIPEGAHFRSLLRSVESALATYRTGDTNA